jgi:hydrogenase-4 component E
MGIYLQNQQLKLIYITAAFSGIMTGLFLIVSRKEIIQHIIGYIVLENAIVLLSFSLGNEMPMAVNAGILLDILISILLFGLFMNRIAKTYKDLDIDQLNKLSD